MAGVDVEVARRGVGQILRFLREFNQVRRPPKSELGRDDSMLWWSALPASGYVVRQSLEDAGAVLTEDVAEATLLSVTRPPGIPAAPGPGNECLAWLYPGWDDPKQQARFRTSRTNDDGTIDEIDEETHLGLLVWQDTRDAWAVRVLPDVYALELFEMLWLLHGRLQREGELFDLVVGDGHVLWAVDGITINHPALLLPVDLEFEPAIPRFSVVQTSRPAEFAESIFRTEPDKLSAPPRIDPSTAGRLRIEAGEQGISPLGGDSTSTFLERMSTSLDPLGALIAEGRLIDHRHAPKPGAMLRVFRDPLLFLRSRSAGYTRAIEDALTSLEEREINDLPLSLLALAGAFPDQMDTKPYNDGGWLLPDEQDALLTKPANREQLSILRRLEFHDNVLVQGPPGTGKTHTIANLLGHLLAEGKTVLVTAETPKALRVLREKVISELQPLCVSVLEGDSASNMQLRESADAISARIARDSAPDLLMAASRLSKQRQAVLDRIRSNRDELFALVQTEYELIETDGFRGTPSEAAQRLAERAGTDGWLPGPLDADSLPLSANQLHELYATNEKLSAAEEQEIRRGLPALEGLPAPSEFAAGVHHAAAFNPSDPCKKHWREPQCTLADLEEFESTFLPSIQWLGIAADWQLEALHAGALGPDATAGWAALVNALEEMEIAQAELTIQQGLHGPKIELPYDPGALLVHLDAMIAHVSGGRTFGGLTKFTNRQWDGILRASKTVEGPARTEAQLRAIRTIPRADVALQDAHARWQLMLGRFGLEPPQDGIDAGERGREIRSLLGFVSGHLNGLFARADGFGLDLWSMAPFSRPVLRPAQWKTLGIAVSEALPGALEYQRRSISNTQFELMRGWALGTVALATQSPGSIATELSSAIEDAAVEAYSMAHSRLSKLAALETVCQQRDAMLATLEQSAPAWATLIRERTGAHGLGSPPGDASAAWQFRLLATALDKVSGGSAAPILDAVATDRQELSQVTIALADRKAWAALIQRTDQSTLAALRSYAVGVKKMRKGTGAKALGLQSMVRGEMEKSRDAVPVWIAPLYRVAETFDARRTRFDVVIIDEASQLDVTGLLAWFFGKQVIVVGDDEQVTPEGIGIGDARIQTLIDTYLPDIPRKQLYDTQTSVFHLAQTVFSGSVQLREHFRCVPDIIGFSNELSYDWKILPLRNVADANVIPAVIPEYVEGAERNERSTNEREAEHVASLVAAAHEQPEYAGLTFGVISLLATGGQASLIERKIHGKMSPADIETRRLVSGTPPQFQGDERDVIFLSMVDGRPDSPPHRLRNIDDGRFKKRYNVAVSRAKDQLWVVHSLLRDPDLQTNDLRRRLLEFAFDPSAQRRHFEELESKSGSPLELAIGQRLLAAGYRAEPQHPAGPYFIDFLVSGGGKFIALECDGKYHFADEEQIRKDLDRQALLERIGYEFYRIRGSDFYRDGDGCMSQLFDFLRTRGIVPEFTSDEGDRPPEANELVERVRARAAELRRIWKGVDAPDEYEVAPEFTDVAATDSSEEAATIDLRANDSTIEPRPTEGATRLVVEPPRSRQEITPPPPVENLFSPPRQHSSRTPADSKSTPIIDEQLSPPAATVRAVRHYELEFRAYSRAQLTGFAKNRDLGEESPKDLEPMILEVARVEGPVHFELLIERLRERYSVGRVRESSRQHILRIADGMGGRGRLVIDRVDASSNLFLSVPGEPVGPRKPDIYGTRASAHISGAELEAGLLVFIAQGGGYRNELIEQTAREFGFNRTSGNLRESLDSAIVRLVQAGLATERFGLVRPAST